MPDKKDCIVLFPVYKPLDEDDKIVIKQAINMTQGVDKAFVMPENFVMDESFADFADVPAERFYDNFFTGISGYNRLMLNVDFYKRFDGYKYMLIHQTDAYLFKPDLQYWCDKNYDYIGAPWLKPNRIKKAKFYAFVLAFCPWVYSPHKRRRVKRHNNVGNGGLSLRKIDTFIEILESGNVRTVVDTYIKKQVWDTYYNEDVFWSFEGFRILKKFRKPDWYEAMHFSVEFHPSFAYNLMDKQLPFGCHASSVHEPEFWKKHIPLVQIQNRPPVNVTLITVVYNNVKGIRKTIESVLSQTYRAIEYIIIDGGSNDGTVDIIKQYKSRIAYWHSEPDKGIYDAMNKGISLSSSDYVMFLNSGDSFFGNDSLEKIINANDANYDILYNDLKIIIDESHAYIKKYPSELSFEYFTFETIPHPATLIKKSLFETVGLYDDTLKIVSDWKWFLIAITRFGVKYKYSGFVAANFHLDGISSQKVNENIIFIEKSETLENEFGLHLLPPIKRKKKQHFVHIRKRFDKVKSYFMRLK